MVTLWGRRPGVGRKGTGTFFGLVASTQGNDQSGRKIRQSPAAYATGRKR